MIIKNWLDVSSLTVNLPVRRDPFTMIRIPFFVRIVSRCPGEFAAN